MRKRRHSRNKDESRMCENGFLSFYILVVEKGQYVLIQSYNDVTQEDCTASSDRDDS